MKESASYVHLSPIHRLDNSSQAAVNSGVRMTMFGNSQTIAVDEEKLLNFDGSIQEIQVRLTLDQGSKTKSEIKELKDSIQEKECLIMDLKAKLAASSLENSSKESMIYEQNVKLEAQSELLVEKSKQINFLENQVSKVLRTAEKTEDKLRSSLRQKEVENSELRAKIQGNNSYIDDMQTKLEDLQVEMVTNVQTNKQLELDRKDLQKTSTLLEAKISDLEKEAINKDQSYEQLDEENKQLHLKMKQVKSRRNKQVENLQDIINQCLSINNLILDLRTEMGHKTDQKDHLKVRFTWKENDEEASKVRAYSPAQYLQVLCQYL